MPLLSSEAMRELDCTLVKYELESAQFTQRIQIANSAGGLLTYNDTAQVEWLLNFGVGRSTQCCPVIKVNLEGVVRPLAPSPPAGYPQIHRAWAAKRRLLLAQNSAQHPPGNKGSPLHSRFGNVVGLVAPPLIPDPDPSREHELRF